MFFYHHIHALISKRLRFLLPLFVSKGFCQHPPRPINYSKKKISLDNAPPLKISVVIPSYNQGIFLESTIKSLLNQNYPHLELIIVDGGSTDYSPQIIQKYKDVLHWWCCEPDNGQANALNKGFAHTTGEILSWLNADDCHAPDTLAVASNFFTKHPEVDVLYGNRIHINKHGMEIGRTILPPHNNRILSWADFVPQETLFWRRGLWEKVGARLDESFDFAMDWELLLRFRAARANIKHSPKLYGLFRVHSQQKTATRISDTGFREMQQLREACLGYKPTSQQRAFGVATFLITAKLWEVIDKIFIRRYKQIL